MVQTSWSLMIEDFFNIMDVYLLSISLLALHYQIIAAPACLIVWFLFLQINARATYGLSFGGTSPDIFSLDRNSSSTRKIVGNNFDEHHSNIREWKLYLPKAHHPLLLQQHREILRKAKRDASYASPVSRKG